MNVVEGDSTKAAAWTQALEGERAAAMLTDPPYCLLTRRRKKGDEREPKGRKNEGPEVRRFADVRAYREFTEAWMTHAARGCDGPWVIWTNLLGRQPIAETAAALGWEHHWGDFTWGKRTREGNSGEELLRVVEVAMVFGRQPLAELALGDSPRCWASVAGYDDDGEAARWGSHPNHKPFGVLEPLVRQWTKLGTLVIDPFAGSGSIPAALVRLGRRAAGIELHREWAGRVRERLSRAGSLRPATRA
jgi:site-specific DNA-methyltransferase (adenine-specific)